MRWLEVLVQALKSIIDKLSRESIMSRIDELRKHFEENMADGREFQQRVFYTQEKIKAELVDYLGCSEERVVLRGELLDRATPYERIAYVIVMIPYMSRSNKEGLSDYGYNIKLRYYKSDEGKITIQFDEKTYTLEEIHQLVIAIWDFMMADDLMFDIV